MYHYYYTRAKTKRGEAVYNYKTDEKTKTKTTKQQDKQKMQELLLGNQKVQIKKNLNW